MSEKALHGLLTRRLSEEGMPLDVPISVAELHKRLLPYRLCRAETGFTTKAEYDIAFLELLRDDECTEVEEAALLEALAAELDSPEPGLAVLKGFAASEVRVRVRSGEDESRPESGPPIVEYEMDVEPGDLIPGLDDPLLVPEPAAEAEAPGSTRPAGSESCLQCGSELPSREGIRFCPRCGANQWLWPCAECAGEVERGWRYCPMCGQLQPGV
jgi:predicted RNA-binding Zn-ribbon protein involved in translation (DUF1610 family)